MVGTRIEPRIGVVAKIAPSSEPQHITNKRRLLVLDVQEPSPVLLVQFDGLWYSLVLLELRDHDHLAF